MEKVIPKKMNPATQKKEEDWTSPTKEILADIKFLNKLQTFDKEGLSQKIIDLIKPFTEHEDMNIPKLKGINSVAASLCAWVLAMEKYYNVNLIVKPKKAALAIAEKEYAILNAELNIKKENLRVVQERVARLQAQLKAAQDEKSSLEA